MKVDPGTTVPAPPVRTIGILAHIDAGKTSLTERLLFVSGRVGIAGDVDDGTTLTDYLPIERERGITVKAAAANMEWAGCRINLLDTPGHVDFGNEVERSLQVLDGAVLVVCGVAGIQSRTEMLAKACDRRHLPRIVFVNKMDRRGADFRSVLSDLRDGIDPKTVALAFPVGSGESFRGTIDLIDMVFLPALPPADLTSGTDPGGIAARYPIPAETETEAAELRSSLMEALASCDDSMLDHFVSGTVPERGELLRSLNRAVLGSLMTPVLCGSAFCDSSARSVLDYVVHLLPSPREARVPVGTNPETGLPVTRTPSSSDPFSATVFKTLFDSGNGPLSWARVWSGSLARNDAVLDVRIRRRLKVRRLYSMLGNRLEEIAIASAGDIVALSFAQQPGAGETGTTLCDPGHPVQYESFSPPEPVVTVAIEPRSANGYSITAHALAALVSDDPALRLAQDAGTGRFELAGLGELHLEIALSRLANEYDVKVRSGTPRVAYRETPRSMSRVREDFDRELGGERVRVSVEIEVRPAARGEGVSVRMTPGLRVASHDAAAVSRGVSASLTVGSAYGFPLDDAIALVHDVKSISGSPRVSETAIEAASAIAVRRCLDSSGCSVLEPIMTVEVEVPDQQFGPVVAAITARGGRIEAVEDMEGGKLVLATAAMANLFGFASVLRSASHGRAMFQAGFHHFEVAGQVTPGA